MIECIGYQIKAGSFEDDKGRTVDYDNVMLYYITDDSDEIIGYFGKEQKIANKKVEKINFKEWSECIGKMIEVRFNMFGATPRLDGVKIVGEGVITKFLNNR